MLTESLILLWVNRTEMEMENAKIKTQVVAPVSPEGSCQGKGKPPITNQPLLLELFAGLITLHHKKTLLITETREETKMLARNIKINVN